MVAIANVILAAAEAEYVGREWWALWADRRLLRFDGPAPIWLINLSLAPGVVEVYDALGPWLDKEQAIGVNRPALIAGFIYLRFEEGRLALEPMLVEVGQEVDGVNVDRLSPELVNLALCEVGTKGVGSSARVDAVLLRLAKLGSAAREQLAEVESCSDSEIQR